MPAGFRLLRDLITTIRADFVSNIVKEGQFVTLDSGVTFHYREKSGDALLGIFFQDRREADRTAIYIAERGKTAEADGNSFLILEKGTVQREDQRSRDSSIIAFERYALNLSSLGGGDGAGGDGDGDKVIYKPRERTTYALLFPDRNDGYYKLQAGRFRAELHNRLSAPLYPIAFMLVAFAALGEARTTRQGRGVAIQSAILTVGALRIGAYAAWTASVSSAFAAVLLYVLPLASIVFSIVVIVSGHAMRQRVNALLAKPVQWLIAFMPRMRRA